jgi:hypothetical protein
VRKRVLFISHGTATDRRYRGLALRRDISVVTASTYPLSRPPVSAAELTHHGACRDQTMMHARTYAPQSCQLRPRSLDMEGDYDPDFEGSWLKPGSQPPWPAAMPPTPTLNAAFLSSTPIAS